MIVTPAQIRAAADIIRPHVRSTPVLELDRSEFAVDADVVLKLEYLQHSGTFKARGASHFVATQPVSEAGIVAASGGNHGAAVAWAAQRFGLAANIFVPTISAPAKVERLRSYGAIVHQAGAVYADALAASEEFRTRTGATSIHAYNEPVVMAGAGTCGLEFETQARSLDAVLVACGGGGLSGGIASWFGDRTEVVVCETEGTPTYARAKDSSGPVDVDVTGLAGDALGATRLGDNPWEALSAVDASSVLVTDSELSSARNLLWDQFRIVVEPSAAAPVAALVSGRWAPPSDARVGLILCGANTSIG